MRIPALQLAFVLLPIMVCAQAQTAPATPAPPQSDADRARATAEATNGEACAEVCLDSAKKLAELSNQDFTNGNVEAAQQEMKDAGKYAEKAGRASIDSHKHQKQTEIGLRRLTKRMKDIVQTLNFEDRPPVEQIIKSVEAVRSDVLLNMFGNPKKTFDQSEDKKKEKK